MFVSLLILTPDPFDYAASFLSTCSICSSSQLSGHTSSSKSPGYLSLLSLTSSSKHPSRTPCDTLPHSSVTPSPRASQASSPRSFSEGRVKLLRCQAPSSSTPGGFRKYLLNGKPGRRPPEEVCGDGEMGGGRRFGENRDHPPWQGLLRAQNQGTWK